MSLKDDFLEALNSVKKDFFHNPSHTDPPATPNTAATEPPQQPTFAAPGTEDPPAPPETETDYTAPAVADDVVFRAFEQASTFADNDDDNDELHSASTLYRDYDPALPAPAAQDTGAEDTGNSRKIFDFEADSVYSDDKTVISRNTIIRGALQTEDSLRLLGQILGDIDCKSNVVLAGKVRGNTSAANAYIFDAQVDGDIRCDDTINIGSDAWVLGNIRAQQAEVDGKVKGNIEIRNNISIGSTSSILGDISTDELEIKRGAFVNGQIMMYSPSRDVIDHFDRFDD